VPLPTFSSFEPVIRNDAVASSPESTWEISSVTWVDGPIASAEPNSSASVNFSSWGSFSLSFTVSVL
jgi:hypothetical protein